MHANSTYVRLRTEEPYLTAQKLAGWMTRNPRPRGSLDRGSALTETRHWRVSVVPGGTQRRIDSLAVAGELRNEDYVVFVDESAPA